MTWTRQPLTVAILGAAAYRLTRLATRDPFPPAIAARSAVEDWLADSRAAAYAHGPTCPWCVGFWAACATVAAAEAADRRGHLDTLVLAALPWAISAGVGVLSDREVH